MKTLRQPQARNWLTALMLWLTLIFSYGCFREYYRPKEKALDDVGSVLEQQPVAKYFIVHQGDRSYHLDQPALSDDYLLGQLEPLPPNHLFFAQTKPDRANRYRGPKEKHVLNEVHVWLKPEEAYDLGQAFREGRTVRLESQAIDRIEFYEMDHTATTGSHVIGAIGIGAVVTGFILAIASSRSGGSSSPPPSSPGSASSCPYAYLFDGSEFQLAGELFPGALLPNLERNDFLSLPGAQPLKGEHVIRLRNELQEIQYINQVQLVTVDHPADYTVGIDQDGVVHGLRDLVTPREAQAADGRTVMPFLQAEDSLSYLFTDMDRSLQEIVLRFDRLPETESANLVLRARNTPWMETMWYTFSGMYGGFYDSWHERLLRKPADELKQWMAEQHLFLNVEVQEQAGWTVQEELLMAGPLAYRNLVVPLDLSEVSGPTIKVRLRTGFQLWDLDYAALSYAQDPDMKVTYQAVKTAYANDAKDYQPELAVADDRYLTQEQVGDEVELRFDATLRTAGQTQSLFLMSRGHYEPLRDFSGMPEILSLNRFKKSGYFATFSRESYIEALADRGITWLTDDQASPTTENRKEND